LPTEQKVSSTLNLLCIKVHYSRLATLVQLAGSRPPVIVTAHSNCYQ